MNKFNKSPLNDDYKSEKEKFSKSENPLDDDYGFYKNLFDKSENSLDDDYIKEEYRD